MNDFQEKKDIKKFLLTLFSIACIGCTVYGLKTICIDSAWNWTFQQKEFWSSLFEIFVLFIALSLSICVPKSKLSRLILTFVVVCAFSYLHAMFFVVLAMCLYALMIWMTGCVLCRLLCKDHKQDPLACILLGLTAIIIIVGICSAFKIGTPEKLRIVYAVLFVLEAIVCWKELRDSVRSFFQRKCEDDVRFSANGLIHAGIISAIMIQVGRACISLDYDSLWYGLRSNTMLAPFTGIYDQVISTGTVYIYPKGIECLSLAFSFTSTYSFVYGVNLMLAALCLYTVYKIARLFCKKTISLFVALLCAVTPGIMNMAVTAKSDIVTLLIQLLVVYFVVRAIKYKSGSALMLSVSATIFSFCFKPSSIVFSSILILPAIIIFIINKIHVRLRDLPILVLPIAANAFLMIRTWLLTGMPFTQYLTGIFSLLGFSYKYPYVAEQSSMVSLHDFFKEGIIWERLPRLWSFLFEPVNAAMDHVIIAWGGTLFAICWLILVIYVFSHPKRTLKKIKDDAGYAYSLITVALVSAISMGSMLLLEKPDGNYYMLMYALTFLHLAIEMRDYSSDFLESCCKKTIPLVVSGAILCLLTSWAWSVGFTPFEFESESNLDTKVETKYNEHGYYNHMKSNEAYFKNIGVDRIADKLANEGGKQRVMIISNEGPRLLSIPAISENWLDLSHWGNSELSNTSDGLYNYFKVSNTKYLLIERSYVESSKKLVANLSMLAQNGYLTIDTDEGNYILVSFNKDGGQQDTVLCDYLDFIVKNTEQ